ncbi:hypothetical protein MJG53_019051 [Ovis ammon polii x Ovis aries]|uniref:Uncharacterized protein n=1 Tax=Ovis ammon polii x Ovis aries TaxID=2918886 RepID=A0ACB9U245_9CETA|nr:hypothetical protein MJG53_019051 [Ovis ammon polii x Ovis aries]
MRSGRVGAVCTDRAEAGAVPVNTESADVEIRHDLPGVFTGNGAAHGQNFKSSTKSDALTELPGCREWVVSRAQRRARVTQTDGGSPCLYEIRAVFPKEGFSLRTAAVKQADNCLFAPGLIVRFVLTSGPNYPHDESADVEIRHDLPGVFTGNGAAHGQNFKSSAKSEPPTELPGCQEWVVSRAQRRARVTQTDGGLHGATAGRGAHEHSGRIWIENTGELGGHRGDDLCGRASERRELLREKVPQLLNDPFESIDCPSEDTEVRDHMAPWAVL